MNQSFHLAATGRSRASEFCRNAAMVVLLSCMAARVFISEMPYRDSLLRSATPGGGDTNAPTPSAGREELARVTFPPLIILAVGLWLAGGALSGRLTVKHPVLAVMIAVLAVWSLLAAFAASDKRSALDAWIEQLALMWACLLAVQLLGDKGRFVAFTALLAAIGGVLAVKGFWQVGVEIPERIGDFQANRAVRLAELGFSSGSAASAVFEARLRATTPTGFFVMSNLYASLLVIAMLAAVGLAADKTRLAVATWRAGADQRRAGQVHLPALAAGLAWLLAIACAVALVLSRSRGGIVAAAVFLLVMAAVVRWKNTLAVHWRKAVIAMAVVFALAAGAVVAYGLSRGSLPTKTMAFRWYYWTGGARIAMRHPWLGAGPGNFASAYLQVRPAGAEEAVKDPHNVIVHAATQYGLPGGAMYLAIVAYVLAALARPRRDTQTPPLDWATPSPSPPVLIACTAAAALATRALVAGSTVHGAFFVFDTVLPVVVFAVMMMAALWIGWRWPSVNGATGAALTSDFSRIALAAGTAGFMLHGMIEISPWAPGAAMVFWVSAGACLAVAGPVKELDLSRIRWLKAVGAMAFLATIVVVLWQPVYRRITRTDSAAAALASGDIPKATLLAEQAAIADGLDPWSASDAAGVILAGCPRQGPKALDGLARAGQWALEAACRDGAYHGHLQLLANIEWARAVPDSFTYSWNGPGGVEAEQEESCRQAAEAGATDAMSQLAGLLLDRGDHKQAVEWLAKAIASDPDSAVLAAHLAEAHWRAGQTAEAATAWRRAAKLSPPAEELRLAVSFMRRATERLDPANPRLRLDYAQMLVLAGAVRECLDQLAAAEGLNNALPAESLLRFNESETSRLAMLRAWGRAIWDSPSARNGHEDLEEHKGQ